MKLPLNLNYDTLFDLIEKSTQPKSVFVVHKLTARKFERIVRSLTYIGYTYSKRELWYNRRYYVYRIQLYRKSWIRKWAETLLAYSYFVAALDAICDKEDYATFRYMLQETKRYHDTKSGV